MTKFSWRETSFSVFPRNVDVARIVPKSESKSFGLNPASNAYLFAPSTLHLYVYFMACVQLTDFSYGLIRLFGQLWLLKRTLMRMEAFLIRKRGFLAYVPENWEGSASNVHSVTLSQSCLRKITPLNRPAFDFYIHSWTKLRSGAADR